MIYSMGNQAPAGWYPDGQGNERFWDGVAWTEDVRKPQPTPDLATPKRDGVFSKVSAKVTNAAAERQAARSEANRQHEEARTAAGALATSAVFAGNTVEIYQGGYVRIAPRVTSNTPFEQLRGIGYEPPKGEDTNKANAAISGVTGLLRGGVGALANTSAVTGLVTSGLQELAAASLRKSVLTITTDKTIHTLADEGGPGKSTVGHALAAAGRAVIVVDNPEYHDLLTRGEFGDCTVEIYQDGFVRVAADIVNSTPYEKLRSIKFTRAEPSKSLGVPPAVVNASALASGLMKGKVAGLVSEGIRKVGGGAELAKSNLTIVTDAQIHSLVEGSSVRSDDVGAALEDAGNSVLGAASAKATEPTPPTSNGTVGEKLRELAALHQDGILSDDEFAAAKATLLGAL
ncbi:DUF2510 domain-containing protein [Microbacterium sp. MC2]